MEGADTTSTSPVTGAALHAFIQDRREPGESLYGVVDAARDKELAFEGAIRHGWVLQWLFSEDTPAHMRDVAPYVVPITYEPTYPYEEGDYLDLWARRLGRSAGILLLAPVGPKPLRLHLREIFQVTDEQDREYYMRFYDPRMLRLFLPTCTGDEAQEFFGPIRAILVESDEPGKMLSCWPGPSGVEIKEEALAQPEPSQPTGGYRR